MLTGLIGLAMKLYRRSPFYPRFGRVLAKALLFCNRRRALEPVVREIDGIRFELDLNEVIDASLYYSGEFEADAERALAAILKPGMSAVDVGANIGYHTLRMARLVGPEGRVIAIEPTSTAFTRLQRNAALNSFDNLLLLNLGLDEADRCVQEVAFRSSYRLDGTFHLTREPTLLKSLDSVVAEAGLTRLDFIKIDVDGYEAKVFRGGRATIRRFRPAILFELAPTDMARNHDHPQEIVQFLLSLDYLIRSEAGAPIDNVAALCERVPKSCSINLVAIPQPERP